MKRLIKPTLNCLLGFGGPVLIYGGVHGFITLLKLGGFRHVMGAVTDLIGTLLLLLVYLMLLHDTVWPAVRTKILTKIVKVKKTVPPTGTAQ